MGSFRRSYMAKAHYGEVRKEKAKEPLVVLNEKQNEKLITLAEKTLSE